MTDSYAAVWRTRWQSMSHFAVAMVIARYQDRFGVCRLKQKTIARLAYCSPRQVAKVLQDMRDADPPQIVSKGTMRADGSKGVNVVQLTLAAHVRTDDDPLVTAADFYLEYPADRPADGAGPDDDLSVRGSHPDAIKVPNDVQNNSKLASGKASSSKQVLTPSATDSAPGAFKAYNELAARLGLPIAETLTETRAKKLRKRIDEVGLEGWNRALANVEKSKFLSGETRAREGREPFRANLDFLLQASSFQKVLEGHYGHDRTPKGTQGDAVAFQARMQGDRAFMLNLVTRWTQDPASWPALAGPAPGAPGCLVPGEIVARVTGAGPDAADALGMALQAHAPRAQQISDDAGMIE